MRSRAALPLILLAACGAELGPGGGGGGQSDASAADSPRLNDAAIAMVDARPCVGGDAAQSGPDGTCFVRVATPVTYNAAGSACMAMNAHLAYLKNAAIDTFAEQFIGNVDTWIGGNDIVTEMTFVWDDGTPFGFTNWHVATNEPNNGGGGGYQEDCVIIAGSRVGKQWDDRPCDASEVTTSGKFAYLCNY